MGGTRGKRKLLATGIYSDRYGIGIQIQGKEHRFPLGTPLADLLRKRRDLIDDARIPKRRGTLSADIDAFLRTIPEGRRRAELSTELEHWRTVFGDRASQDLQPIDIRQQLAAWRKKSPNGRPFSPKHCNNLIHSLRAVYTVNHGRARNPALDVPVFRVRYDDARAMPSALIDRIIGGMADDRWPATEKKIPPPNLAKLRLRVMQHTGLSQAMLKRILPQHLEFKRKTMFVTTRLKGAGVEGATLKLTDRAVAAFRALVRAGGLGAFSSRSLAQAWRRAVTRARGTWEAEQATKPYPKPWPLAETVRAYDLRHSFGTWVVGQFEYESSA